MPKPKQTSFLKRDIPQMPEGYYSGDQPNPNMRRFVEEHATLYDPATDDYHVPPFNEKINISKRKSPSMDLHIYWSKKVHDAIRQYIRHYTQPDDLVLDPLCGSGGTALAALMEGRSTIAIDRSPAATFISKNYCTPVDADELQLAFEELQAKVKPEIDWLYETCCDRCDGRATTAYTVYSYVFQCNRCLTHVPLFDCVEATGQTTSGKPKKITVCPYCRASGHIEEINVRRNKRFEAVPVVVSYLCEEGCSPKRSERLHNDPDPKKRSYFEQYDVGKLREIETKEIPHWYPPQRMMNEESDTERWGDKWRAGTSNFRTVAELYTKRNLWALSAIRKYCGESSQRDFLLFVLNTAVLTVSKMCRHDYPSVMAGTYYLPQISRELNVFENFSGRISRKLAGISEIAEGLKSASLLISTQSATCLDDIPTNSVDLIFTDPPYADKVQYGELNFIWEAWLGLDTDWHDDEIIVNNTRGLSDSDWVRLMSQAMSECYRVLKPGRWLSLCYHDTSEGTWQLVQDLMTEIGFIPEQSDSALYIDVGQKSFNQLIAEKVTKRDLVINFRKPRPDEITQLLLFGDEDPATFAQKARAILAESLEQHPGSTADHLYDDLVSRMVRKGEFERHNFDDLLQSVAEDPHGDGRWYLLETAGQLDEAESAKEKAAAARLEAFMWQHAETSEVFETSEVWPVGFGVHYSDLFEQYLPVLDKPRRLLQEWLPEFFFKTGDGTWRPPANEEERQQKAALRSGGTLRRIKRFTKALLDGVPPHDRDRPPNPATAADWLRQCRRAGLYELGRAIYEKGGSDFESLDDEAYMEVEEDYQLCVRRSR